MKEKKGTKKAVVEKRVANAADFGKKTTPVRERMAKEIKETPPEERLKRGR
ncbi:MAG TPA: hypothetical protein VH253_02130 [Phycisphaerae bacterium]|nr:hypothetical protein [Phycisphaerae bacterium]